MCHFTKEGVSEDSGELSIRYGVVWKDLGKMKSKSASAKGDSEYELFEDISGPQYASCYPCSWSLHNEDKSPRSWHRFRLAELLVQGVVEAG